MARFEVTRRDEADDRIAFCGQEVDAVNRTGELAHRRPILRPGERRQRQADERSDKRPRKAHPGHDELSRKEKFPPV
jgi:hypothetical protein